MKLTKKILALVLVIGTLASFCISAGAASRSYAISATTKGGYVYATFIVKNAAGMTTCGRTVTYDKNVLELVETTTGAFKDQYTKCGQSVMVMYNTKTAGKIVPGFVFREQVLTDSEFKSLVKSKNQTFTPVKTANFVLFTAKFKVKNSTTTKTTIKWGSTEKAVTIRLAGAVSLGSVKLTDTGVKVSWTAQKYATSYMIYRKTSASGSWKKVGSTTNTTYTDTTVSSGTTYYYTVRSVRNGFASVNYNKTGLKIKYVKTATPKAKNTNGAVSISWGKTSNATKYTLYRRVYSSSGWGAWKKLSDNVSSRLYYDRSVTSGKLYQYKVTSYNGTKFLSNRYSSKIRYMATPVLKNVRCVSKKITLTWNNVSGETGFIVYRKASNETAFKKIGTTKANVLQFTDSTATVGTTYTYYVRSYCKDGSNYTSYSVVPTKTLSIRCVK